MFEIHPDAAEEAREAKDWYEAESNQAARLFEGELRVAFAWITERPTAWPPGLYKTRFFKLDRFPYMVIYRAISEDILVVAVAHTSRRPGYWRERLRG
jgi:plasmid stabilization system protein ParE